MTANALLTVLQILIPSALFGALILGGASSSVARWLGLRRRPFRLGSRRISLPRAAPRMGTLVPVQVTSEGIAAGRRRSPAGPDRRAA